MIKEDVLKIGGQALTSRLFVGTGKFGDDRLIPEVIAKSGAQVVTVALRRMDFEAPDHSMLPYIPKECVLMPNTSGARTADEAIRIARLARAAGCGDWIKIEIVSDNKYLLPDNGQHRHRHGKRPGADGGGLRRGGPRRAQIVSGRAGRRIRICAGLLSPDRIPPLNGRHEDEFL